MSNGYKTLSELASAYKVDPRTLKSYIKQKMPIVANFWYSQGPKRLYSPKEIEHIKEQLGSI